MIIVWLILVVGFLLYLSVNVCNKFDMVLRIDEESGDVDKETDYRDKSNLSMEDQLVEVLLMIGSCLKAGRNLDQAFELVAISTPPPIRDEFRILIQERRLGVPIVDALTNLAKRVKSPDLQLAVSATIFQQETGGNLEDLYSQIVTTVIERKRIMGKIVAGTVHAKMSGHFVSIIPLVVIVIMGMVHPNYLMPLITTWEGQVALAACICLMSVGVFIINRMTSSILPDASDVMIERNKDEEHTAWNVFRGFLRPFIKINEFLSSAFGSSFFEKMEKEGKYLTEVSHFDSKLNPNEYLPFREICALLVMILTICFVSCPMSIFSWIFICFSLFVGFRIPRLYFVSLIRRRQRNIEFELPYIIDLLSLAIEAGLDLTGGIAKIVEKSPNTDIISEFKVFLSDIQVGKSMEEALSDMAERVQVLSFFSFVSALIQAQKLGADIGPTLRIQSEQMRQQRMLQTETKVNKLPVKLLVPLVLCIFPCLTVILIGPAMINVQKSLPNMDLTNVQEVTSQASQGVTVYKSETDNKVEPAETNTEEQGLKSSIVLTTSPNKESDKNEPAKSEADTKAKAAENSDKPEQNINSGSSK